MSIDLELEDNELRFDGDLYLVDGIASCAQRVEQALNIVRGQWFLDVREGVPWRDLITALEARSAIDAGVRSTVESVEGVERVERIESEVDGGVYIGRIWITYDDGTTALEELEIGL